MSFAYNNIIVVAREKGFEPRVYTSSLLDQNSTSTPQSGSALKASLTMKSKNT
jgi:hypothetical protein